MPVIRLRPRHPFQKPGLLLASPRRRLKRTHSSLLTVPPKVLLRTRSMCTKTKLLRDKPRRLIASHTGLTTVTVRKRLAATQRVGPPIRGTGPIDIVSAARTARPRLVALTPVRRLTNHRSNIHLADKVHPLVCLSTTTAMAESLGGRTGTSLATRIIAAVITENKYMMKIIAALGALAILGTTIPENQPTMQTAMSTVPMSVLGLVSTIPESHRPPARTTITVSLFAKKNAAVMHWIIGIVMIKTMTLAARSLQDAIMPERKPIMTTLMTAATPQVSTGMAATISS